MGSSLEKPKYKKPPKSSGYGKIPPPPKKPTAESLMEEYGIKS